MSWQLNELEFEHIEQWPRAARLMLTWLVCTVLVLVGGYFFIADNWMRLQQSMAKEAELKRIFVQKAQVAASLPVHQQQVDQLQSQLNTVLQQLPSKRDVAKVLHDINALVAQNGLTLDGFKWEAEHGLAFATELPLRISVQGQYHQLGQFVADIAALPRIVIIDSFNLTKQSREQAPEWLTMNILAKTYTYQSDAEASTP